MKFKSLKIEAVDYGENKGKIIAEICIEGDKAKTTMQLPPEFAERILTLAKDAIINAVEQSANDFIFELTTHIPNTLLLP